MTTTNSLQQKDAVFNRSIILGIVAIAFAILAIANDFTILTVVLPTIETQMHTDVTTVQWLISGYTLVFGVLLVSGGRLADMFGRRRIFFIGAGLFAGFSLLGGLATDIWMLLAARALMGVGGALMWPAVLGLLYDLMPTQKAGLAGALIIGVCGFGNTMGPLLGGALTEMVSWRWIFFFNVPIMLLAMLITWRAVPEHKPDTDDKYIDYRGVTVLSISLFALLLALDWGIDVGFVNPLIAGLLITFAVAMGVFVYVERRAGRRALIPTDLANNRQLKAASVATILVSATFFATLLYLVSDRKVVFFSRETLWHLRR